MNHFNIYKYIWIASVGFSSCAARKETFESLVSLRNERRSDFSHRRIVNTWPDEELARFKILSDDDQTKYLVYRLAKETSIDGERAFLIMRLVSAYNQGDQSRLRKQVASLPHDRLVKLYLGVGGSKKRLFANLTMCEKLGKPYIIPDSFNRGGAERRVISLEEYDSR